ncbi:MFS transporter [Aquibacillus koreensis]|uniref:MFS transporter n=1 Tax=Aquibacillus koreensis TaxID=279446 RepID=A0A9X3WN71_9BACI|nr:MFS transporter [Aquibacillus koreensis]MCT2536934.1 MFS transporter [Aquibacillus koreensis]MDC3421935.1 MFS transporter [Aquibacillus koreensis]
MNYKNKNQVFLFIHLSNPTIGLIARLIINDPSYIMAEVSKLKVATGKIHIFIVLFLVSLIMRVQIPVFTPFAAAFGASSVLIGIILSVTSLSNLSGNLLAGPLVDRFGKKVFVTLPMFASGIFFIAHGLASSSTDLLVLHGLNGFALAFFIPAAYALLSGYARNSREQGKNMAVNGILSTIASIAAPLIGGKLVVIIGYVNTYFLIGAAMIVTGIYAIRSLQEKELTVTIKNQPKGTSKHMKLVTSSNLVGVYLIGFAVMYIHGVLIYEIPYLTVDQGVSTFRTGQLFSYMGLGTLLTLCLFFIHRFSPLKRLVVGLFGMSITLVGLFMALLPLPLLLFSMGVFFGLVMPAMATAITDHASNAVHGRAFAYMSAVFSLGIITSSFITGVIRSMISPYFVAFLVGMTILTVVVYLRLRSYQDK